MLKFTDLDLWLTWIKGHIDARNQNTINTIVSYYILTWCQFLIIT